MDDRTIEKFEREAKEKNRDSWRAPCPHRLPVSCAAFEPHAGESPAASNAASRSKLRANCAYPFANPRYMAYIMDTNEEERAKGKTVEARNRGSQGALIRVCHNYMLTAEV